MFKKASPTPPEEGLSVLAEGVVEARVFVGGIFCYFNDAGKPPLREGVGGGFFYFAACAWQAVMATML